MSLLLRTHYNLAKTSLKQNRTRSFLTCLGIAIGVASIILTLSLMGSIKNLIASQVSSIGANLIVVRPTNHKDTISSIISELTSSNQYAKSGLTLSDVEIIKQIDNIAAVAPIAVSVNTIAGDKTVNSGTVVGTTPDFIKIQNFPLSSGAFFHQDSQPNSAVIGYSLAIDLFGSPNISLGKTFTILGEQFLVIGVLDKLEDPINFNNVDLDHAAIINAAHLQSLDNSLQIQQINVKAATTDTIAETADTIHSRLVQAKSGDNNFSVAYGDQITHLTGSLLTIITGILTMVASISLIVGGIGVMNIMLVSVSERTHEIGIRKAVGAASSNILLQFLFESLILSLLGGFFGLILGYVIALFLYLITPFAPFISWQILLVTLVTSISVGIIFGLYPALKAARKNPIESLKHYR